MTRTERLQRVQEGISHLLLLAVFVVASLLVAGCGWNGGGVNVILILLDTTRADHLSCYGYDKIRTPHIDEVARRGVLFRQAIAHAPLTLVSTSCILTSLYPPTHGIHYNEGFYLDDSVETLAEVLRDGGYATAAVIGAVVLDSLTGLSQGFDLYDDDFGDSYEVLLPGVKDVQRTISGTQRRADAVTDEAERILDRWKDGEKPFFLFLHYFDPHQPYDPPPPFNITSPLTEEGGLDWLVELYDGEIAFMDDSIGRLLEQIEDWGLLENTLIVITADHGESLEEHDEPTHSFFVYDATLHIPLIFSLPASLPQGRVIEDPVQLVDIFPTILDILDIDGERRRHGRSLLPIMRGEEAASSVTYFESASSNVLFGWSALRGVREGSWKYIQSPQEELYDLTTDPRELHNLIRSDPEEASYLRGLLDSLLTDLEIGPSVLDEDVESKSKESLKDLLGALGYLNLPTDYYSSYEEMFDPHLPDPKDRVAEYRDYLSSFTFFRRGLAYMMDDQPELAVEQFRQAIELVEAGPEYHYFLGLGYMAMKDYDGAESEFLQVLSILSDNIEAYSALAKVKMYEEDPDGAWEYLMKAITLDSTNAELYFQGARILIHSDRLDESIGYLDRTLRLKPDHKRALYLGGRISVETGDYASAVRYFEPLLGRTDLDSLTVIVYYDAGRSYYHLNKLDKAEELTRMSLEIDSTLSLGYNQLGLIYDSRGRYEEAIRYYQRALSLDPDFFKVHSNLGVSYYKMGDPVQAQEEFNRFLAKAEDPREISMVRDFLDRMAAGP